MVTTKKDPKDMTLDELIKFRRDYKMTEEEMEDQDYAIAAAEARHCGHMGATVETVREAVNVIRNEGG